MHSKGSQMRRKMFKTLTARDRNRHVQVGYADGTEKSYIYPCLSVEYSLEDRAPRLTCTTKPIDKVGIFHEDCKCGFGFFGQDWTLELTHPSTEPRYSNSRKRDHRLQCARWKRNPDNLDDFWISKWYRLHIDALG